MPRVDVIISYLIDEVNKVERKYITNILIDKEEDQV